MLAINSIWDIPNFGLVAEKLSSGLKQGVKIFIDEGGKSDTLRELRGLSDKMLLSYGVTKPLSPVQVRCYVREHLTPGIMRHCVADGGLDLTAKKITQVEDSEFITDLLRYRSLYYKALRLRNNGKVVYPKITLGRTNRISYYEPNIITFARNMVYSVFEDEYLVYADVKNQEPLIWYEMSGLTEFKECFKSGKGLYADLFYGFYGRIPEPKELSEFKTCWISAMYCVCLDKIETKYIDVEPIRKYFESDMVKKAKKRMSVSAFRKSKKCVTYFGTVIQPEFSKAAKISSAVNLPVQGTAADIMAILIERCYDKIAQSKYRDLISVYFTRYDEIVFRVNTKVNKEEACAYIKELTEHKVDDWVPFTVDVRAGDVPHA